MIKSKQKKRIAMIVLALVLVCLCLPKIVLAYECPGDYITLQVPIPVPGVDHNDFCVKGFPEYIERIYNFFISVVGILAVIMLMYGGFQWLIAGGNPTKISGAKAQILSALAGLILMLSSYLILDLINPNLTKLQLADIEDITSQGYDQYGQAESPCPLSDAIGQYQEMTTGAMVDGASTKCGETYYASVAGGRQKECTGQICSAGKRCFEGTCVASDWYGYVSCVSTDTKCADYVRMVFLCRDNTTGEYNMILNNETDIDERDKSYSFSNLNYYKTLADKGALGGMCQYNKTGMGVFLEVQIKIASQKGDVDRALSSISSGGGWSSKGSFCPHKDVSSYTKSFWDKVVASGGLMPLDVFKNLPVLYRIDIGDVEQYKDDPKPCQ